MRRATQQVSARTGADAQSEFWATVAGSVEELEPRKRRRPVRVPRVRPLADEELAESFVKAAIAWAKWTERRRARR